MKHNTATTAPTMKKFSSRRDLWNAHKTIAHMVEILAQAMEIANRADSEARRDEEREAGNLPDWAGSNSVFGDLRTALNRVMVDFYGVTLDQLDVNWGGNGSFSRDVFEALNTALVTQQTTTQNTTAKITTYDPAEAQRALAAMNASRQRLGIAPTHIRAFQKSTADGKGDLFLITTHDGQVEDIIREYDAAF